MSPAFDDDALPPFPDPVEARDPGAWLTWARELTSAQRARLITESLVDDASGPQRPSAPSGPGGLQEPSYLSHGRAVWATLLGRTSGEITAEMTRALRAMRGTPSWPVLDAWLRNGTRLTPHPSGAETGTHTRPPRLAVTPPTGPAWAAVPFPAQAISARLASQPVPRVRREAYQLLMGQWASGALRALAEGLHARAGDRLSHDERAWLARTVFFQTEIRAGRQAIDFKPVDDQLAGFAPSAPLRLQPFDAQMMLDQIPYDRWEEALWYRAFGELIATAPERTRRVTRYDASTGTRGAGISAFAHLYPLPPAAEERLQALQGWDELTPAELAWRRGNRQRVFAEVTAADASSSSTDGSRAAAGTVARLLEAWLHHSPDGQTPEGRYDATRVLTEFAVGATERHLPTVPRVLEALRATGGDADVLQWLAGTDPARCISTSGTAIAPDRLSAFRAAYFSVPGRQLSPRDAAPFLRDPDASVREAVIRCLGREADRSRDLSVASRTP